MHQKMLDIIEKLIGTQFDEFLVNFLGIVPKKNNQSRFRLKPKKDSLTHLFITSLNNPNPNKTEEQVLKTQLRVAAGYVEALKVRTQTRVIQAANAHIQEQILKKENIKPSMIRKELVKEMESASNHLKMIVNAESNQCRGTATALKIIQVAADNDDNDPNVFFNVVIDERNDPETYRLHLLPDRITPRLWKLSHLSAEYHKKGDPTPKLAGTNPNCFVGNKGIEVLTEQGSYKNIKDIKIGDRVLTHTGKFKTVLNTLDWYSKPYYSSFYKIKVKNKSADGLRVTTFKVTPDHKFLTNVGWVEAKSLTTDHKFKKLQVPCATCGKIIDFHPLRRESKNRKNKKCRESFCSKSCVARFQWNIQEHRDNISLKSKEDMNRRLLDNPNYLDERILKANNKTRELVLNKEFWAQKPKNISILQKNTAIINKKLQTNKSSKEEDIVYELVKSVFPTVERQVILEKWCVDMYIPELKVNIEYDGGGHYLPVYTKKFTMDSFMARQLGRDVYLNKCDIHVLRYSHIPTVNEIKEDVVRVSNNTAGNYSFVDCDIVSIDFIKNGKGAYKLYDITVEDDESFVVNGIISHNCRCHLTFMPKSMGFSSDGKITWKKFGHDEYEFQKNNYPPVEQLNDNNKKNPIKTSKKK
jgi:very-short-patch-repair endonuclease